MMNYIIIPTSELEWVRFDHVKENNPTTVRYSLDGNYFILKYDGEQPDFCYNISGDLVGLREYSHQEILEIIQGSEWSSQD